MPKTTLPAQSQSPPDRRAQGCQRSKRRVDDDVSADAMSSMTNKNKKSMSAQARLKKLAPRRKANIEKELEELKMKHRKLQARLRKQKRVQKALNRERDIVPRPSLGVKGGPSLRDGMGLSATAEARAHFLVIKQHVRSCIHAAQLDPDVDWRRQDKHTVGNLIAAVNEKSPDMLKYQGSWATIEIAQRFLKGVRSRERKKLKELGVVNKAGSPEYASDSDKEPNGDSDDD